MRHRRMMEEQHEFNAAVAQSQQTAMGQFQRAYENLFEWTRLYGEPMMASLKHLR